MSSIVRIIADFKKVVVKMEASLSHKVSVSEQLFPFLLAAIETCLIDIVCIGLANIGFLGSTELLFPLWLPFLFLMSVCWLTRYPTNRMILAFPALRRGAGTRSSPPLITLCVFIGILELLFGVCSSLYTSQAFVWASLFRTTYVVITALDAGRLIVVIVVIGFLCWRGVQIANVVVDSSHISRLLRVGLVSIVVVILLRGLQELFYQEQLPHDDVVFFLLVALLGCLSLFAYPLAQRAYLFHFYAASIRESFRRQEYLFLCLLAFFCMLALVSLWSVIVLYNHWLVSELQLGAALMKPGISGQQPPSFVPPKGASGSSHQALVAVFSWFKIVLLVLLIVLIIVLLVRLIRRIMASLPQERNETHESVWSWSLFRQQLKAVVVALFLRFFPHVKAKRVKQRYVEIASSEFPVHTIRQLYVAVLRQASSKGYSRMRSETPNEFRQRLNQQLSFIEPYLGEITDAYIASRYGEYMYSEVEMTQFQETWVKLQQLWQESMTSRDK